MNIIGLGKAGCAIADKFTKYEQYSVFKIGTHLKTTSNTHNLTEQSHPEKYDEQEVKLNFDIEEQVDLIVSGGESICASTLRILENYKHLKIRVFYIKPNHKFLSDIEKLTDKAVFNILQEYTRSKRFDSMYLLEQESISKILGKVPITVFYDKLYDYIMSTIHMINFFDNNETVMSNFKDSPATYCLNTIGVMDIDSGVESLFYPVDNIRETRYYYFINSEQLNTDGDLHDLIDKQINSKVEENMSVMFGIYQSTFSQNYCYIVSKSPDIQKQD